MQIGYPAHFLGTPVALQPGPVPMLGEHTNDILDELGYTASEIAALRDARVV